MEEDDDDDDNNDESGKKRVVNSILWNTPTPSSMQAISTQGRYNGCTKGTLQRAFFWIHVDLFNLTLEKTLPGAVMRRLMRAT